MVFNGNMKRKSISFVMKQLKLRRQVATTSGIVNRRCDIIIKDTDVKIKIRYCKLLRRSKTDEFHWEFKYLIHNDFKTDNMSIDYYVLVGFDIEENIIESWVIPANDTILKRSNIIFIPTNDKLIWIKYKLDIMQT